MRPFGLSEVRSGKLTVCISFPKVCRVICKYIHIGGSIAVSVLHRNGGRKSNDHGISRERICCSYFVSLRWRAEARPVGSAIRCSSVYFVGAGSYLHANCRAFYRTLRHSDANRSKLIARCILYFRYADRQFAGISAIIGSRNSVGEFNDWSVSPAQLYYRCHLGHISNIVGG